MTEAAPYILTLTYVVNEPFWNGPKQFPVDETLRLDVLTADVLVKYGVLEPLEGVKRHYAAVERYVRNGVLAGISNKPTPFPSQGGTLEEGWRARGLSDEQIEKARADMRRALRKVNAQYRLEKMFSKPLEVTDGDGPNDGSELDAGYARSQLARDLYDMAQYPGFGWDGRFQRFRR